MVYTAGVINSLTCASLVVFRVLLRKPFQPALEPVLPKFLKPWISVICFWPKLKVIIIKPFHVRRLELDRYATNSFTLVPVCHVVPVRPAITAGINRRGTTLIIKKNKKKTFLKTKFGTQHFPFPYVGLSLVPST